MLRQAVILAAGAGSRLRPLTDERPKAALPVAGPPLVWRALEALGAWGVRDVLIVVGHRRRALEEVLEGWSGGRLRLVENADWPTTNTLASLLCAAPLVEGDFLLLDGDLLFAPEVLEPLGEPGTRLAVDRGRPLDEEAVKVAVADGRITGVGKRLAPGQVPVAESIGLARIEAGLAPALFDAGRQIVGAGGAAAYYEAALQRLVERGARLLPADVTGRRWVEIDDHDDLRRAERLFAAV